MVTVPRGRRRRQAYKNGNCLLFKIGLDKDRQLGRKAAGERLRLKLLENQLQMSSTVAKISSMENDVEKQMLQVELKTVKESLLRAKQRVKDLRGKLDTAENSRLELKLDVSRLERQVKRMGSEQVMKRHSLESATLNIEMETLKRANQRLKRRINQLEELSASPRRPVALPRHSISTLQGHLSHAGSITGGSDYDSGCWSSVSPANSIESLDSWCGKSDLDDYSTISSIAPSTTFTAGVYTQLEQLRGEIADARQKEQESRQQLEKSEEEMRRKVQELSLDVRAAKSENDSILVKVGALEGHNKELKKKVAECKCSKIEELEGHIERLLAKCKELEQGKQSAEMRCVDLETKLVEAAKPLVLEHCTTGTQTEAAATTSEQTISEPQWRDLEKQTQQLKAENRRLRLQLKMREEDEQIAREEENQRRRRDSVMGSATSLWRGPSSTSLMSLGRSSSFHNDKKVRILEYTEHSILCCTYVGG